MIAFVSTTRRPIDSKQLVVLTGRSSVGLLVTSSGTFTSELLGLAAAWVGDEERLVVLNEELLEHALGGLVLVLLGEGDHGLGDGLTDGQDLGAGTATSDANANVQVLKAGLAQEEDWLHHLHPH